MSFDLKELSMKRGRVFRKLAEFRRGKTAKERFDDKRPELIVRFFKLVYQMIATFEIKKDVYKLEAGTRAGLDGVASELLRFGG